MVFVSYISCSHNAHNLSQYSTFSFKHRPLSISLYPSRPFLNEIEALQIYTYIPGKMCLLIIQRFNEDLHRWLFLDICVDFVTNYQR